MKELKISLWERAVAVLLAITIVIMSMPSGQISIMAAEGDAVTLSGTVTDSVTLAGIEGVTINLASETDDAMISAPVTTDANGAYAVSVSQNSEYTLSFTKEGYKNGTLTQSIADADISNVNILMEEKSSDDSLVFDVTAPEAIELGTIDFANVATSTNQPDAVVQYSSGDETVATVDCNGVITTVSAGTVTITATIAESDLYKASIATYELTINNATANFAYGEMVQTTTYDASNLTWTNTTLEGIVDDVIVSYSIESQTDLAGNVLDVMEDAVATIDAVTGEVSINRSGIIIVKADATTTDSGETSSATYQLTINKAEQSITFNEGFDVSAVYGAKGSAYTNTAIEVVADSGFGTAPITYELTNGVIGEGIVEGFNPTTGTITFKDGITSGSVEVTATKAEDDCYNACSATYTLTITGYETEPTESCMVSGEKQNESGWYSGEVTITAPSGYKISYASSLADNNTWGDSVKWNAEWRGDGTDQTPIIYLRNSATNGITDAIDIGEIKIDATKPTIYEITYSETLIANGNYKLYDGDQITVTISAYDGGSGLDSLSYGYISDGYAVGSNQQETTTVAVNANTDGIVIDDTTGAVSYSFVVPAEFRGKIHAVATDVAGNTSPIETAETIVVDNKAPVVSISLLKTNGSAAVPTLDSDKYKEQITAKVIVEESNFIPELTGATVNGNSVNFDNASWTRITGTDSWQNTITFRNDGVYTLEVKATDLLGKQSEVAGNSFTVDQTRPSDLQITYSTPLYKDVISAITFGYYKSDVTVTLTAKDNLTGVDYFAWEYKKENGASASNVESKSEVIPTENISYSSDRLTATAQFTLTASEYEQFRGNISFYAEDKLGNRSATKHDDGRVNIVDDIAPTCVVEYSVPDVTVNNIHYYKNDITATFTVTEANFYPEDITIWVNGAEQSKDGWTQNGDTWVKTITLTEDGAYVISMAYADRSTNETQYFIKGENNSVAVRNYESQQMVIDTVAPTISIALLDESGSPATVVSNDNYFNQDITARITATDANFAPINTKITLNNQVLRIADYEWKKSTVSPDTWYYDKKLTTDSYYALNASMEDWIGGSASDSKAFYVDKTVPGAERIEISYSGELNAWEKIINAITFGYYAYAQGVEVTVKAVDDTSGIDYFIWDYTRETDVSAINVENTGGVIAPVSYSEDGKTAIATFALTASEFEQYRGNISVVAVDRAGNSSQKNENERINIVDNISPTRVVTYTPAKQVLDGYTYLTKAEYQYEAEGTNSILYYDGDVTVTFQITEANFYQEDVVIRVNGQIVVPTAWVQNGDVWTSTLTLSGDGDYIVKMSYKDRSNNSMQEYISEKIVIDTVAPTIQVTYANQNVQNTVDGVPYYNDVQTATIAITERNFRADDIVATVTAKDAAEADVTVSNYAELLSNRANWVQNGDVYTATVNYSVDANYEFDIAYKDLALHNMSDYATDKFTVDKVQPQELRISYSESVLEEILDAITFGFYNEQMTVTIKALDETSGVYEMDYSLLRGNGASDINTEIVNAKLTSDQIQRNGKEATAEIRVPSAGLSADSQVNGNIKCTVADYSKNQSSLDDERRIVVDNIAPTIEVTYSNPVREENEISYYDGEISVDVNITEANFYPEDVEIKVTRDGADINIAPTWVDQSTDIHVGSFTLHEDGDYEISINYTDKSSNQMEPYTSEQLTIDTEDPTIHVSNIEANQASKEEKIGFTITADDTNFDVSTFEPVLTAVVWNENGQYETREISLGTASTVESGKTYAYTVDNLTEDAIYTLTCETTDMANHTYSMFTLDDGSEHESIQFSVNRNGSNFILDDNTTSLVEQYYIYDLQDDVIVREINVDPVENYIVRLNGEALAENSDYETLLSGGDGQWSERAYIIDKELFAEEGEYSVVVESTDKTETVAYSDVKNAGVSFVVDQSAPIVTISGLENNGRYQTDEQVVTVMPTDEGGRLNSFKAVIVDDDGNRIMDSSGNDISTRIDIEGEALLNQLAENNGTLTFTVPEGLNSKVQIICTDCAVHTDGTTNEYNEKYENITVSQSEILMFYANKQLFYGTIAAIAVPAIGGVSFIMFRRRKKIFS